MKKILAAAVLVAVSVPVSAASPLPNNFNVSVVLSSQCEVTNVSAPTVDFGTYTAFAGPSTAAPTASLTFRCTRGLAPAVTFDTVNGLANGDGVIAGLNYTLSVGGATVGPGTDALPGVAGTADTRSYTVTGGMVAGQAGGTGAASHVRQLILTY
jgi:hypothetical protein